MELFWLLVFEQFTALDVMQDEAASSRQAVAQKWSRTGTVNVAPGQTTEDVVKRLIAECKAAGGVPADALLLDMVLLPNHLVQ
ncbi:hypothetical protein SEA_GALACTICA_97 [Streptomyces phage Galactica]|nr:hypothetical protein SEA_GALACTICA_97 [Streptomyces phage Galactica]